MPDPAAIYNWRRSDGRITTSGQPTEPRLKDLRALGIRHIVNLGLHSHEKALPDEAASEFQSQCTFTVARRISRFGGDDQARKRIIRADYEVECA